MAKIVAPITAVVEFITAEKEGQYGPYRSVLFLDESKTGEDAKLWKSFDPDSEELALLTKGARVQLIPSGDRNGKQSHNIVLLDSVPPTTESSPSQPATPGLTADQKRAIASLGCDVLKAYAFLYEASKKELEPLGASEETIRAATSTALLACQKKFGW